MSRYRAAAIHFGICAVAATVIFVLFWFVWYPYPLAAAMGGTEILFVLLIVDVALGPLLTLIVFKPSKRTLRFDLATIGCVQAVALTYGLSVLLSGRPVYIAALGHRFDLVQASEVEDQHLRDAGVRLPWFGPVWTGTRAPDSKAERETIMFGGSDLGTMPMYHVPLSEMQRELLMRAKPISQLKSLNPGRSDEINKWLADRGYTEDRARYQMLYARALSMAVVYDAVDAHIIGVAPFTPIL
jgi:hypothetical protein